MNVNLVPHGRHTRAHSSTRRRGTATAARAALLLAAFATAPAAAAAQDAEALLAADTLTPSQQAQLQVVLDDLDARIRTEMADDPKIQQVMRAGLTGIANGANPFVRAAAAATYRERHRAYYERVLQRAGVNLGDIAARLEAAIPGADFQVADDFALVATLRNRGRAKLVQSLGPAAKSSALAGFKLDSRRACAPGAGGGITSTSNSATSTARANAGGLCTSTATMKAAAQVPATAQRAALELTGRIHAAGEAFATTASSLVRASAALAISCTDPETGRPGPAHDLRTVMVMAPLLWVARADVADDGVRIDAPGLESEERCGLTAHAGTATLSRTATPSVGEARFENVAATQSVVF